MNYLELKFMVLKYFELHPDEAKEFKSELEYLRIAEYFPEVIFCNGSAVLACRNTDYVLDTLPDGLKEVTIGNIKVYFPKEYSLDAAASASMLLVSEQSIESAHRYNRVPKNTAVFDVGASEGFFGRLYCDESNEIFSFDEMMWMDANLKTLSGFDAYFIPGLVKKDSRFDFEFHKPLGCIKIDVEGTELDIIDCFEGLIREFHPMIQVAVYHYKEEADYVVARLKELGYNNFGQVAAGKKMLYMNQDQRPPFFRYGVIIANP